jgi:hypothetical protein
VSRECTNPDSDAGVAYAKLKAVYPNKTREMLASGDPCTFANEPAIKAMLGTVRHLQEKSAPELYRGLQQYIDSKEKPTMITSRSSMEFWPLVKVVRIYTKAAALSTGAVIVDLVSTSLSLPESDRHIILIGFSPAFRILMLPELLLLQTT